MNKINKYAWGWIAFIIGMVIAINIISTAMSIGQTPPAKDTTLTDSSIVKVDTMYLQMQMQIFELDSLLEIKKKQ